MTALEKSRGYLQARLDAALRMKRTPQLQFVYDEHARQRHAHRGAPASARRRVLGEEAPEISCDGASRRGRRDAERRRCEERRREGAAPADLAAVCRRMRGERRVALAVHENPDTDALGAAAGMLDLFAQLGVDGASARRPTTSVCRSEAYLLPAGARRPRRCRRRTPRSTRSTAAASSRLALPARLLGRPRRQHRPPPRQHAASATLVLRARRGEQHLRDRLRHRPRARRCGRRRRRRRRCTRASRSTPGTSATQHDGAHLRARAAWLVELGVDVDRESTRCSTSSARCDALRLWARAVAGARARGRRPGAGRHGRRASDYAATGAGEDETEGIVDSLRGVGGVEVAALVKEQTGGRARARQPALGRAST